MADRWDGCVAVATRTIDLDRLLRAFRGRVAEDQLVEREDAPDGLPVLDDALRLPRGAVDGDHLLVGAPFQGVALLLVSPPPLGDQLGRSDAPPEYGHLADAVRDALPGAPSVGWAQHERTGSVCLSVNGESEEYLGEDEGARACAALPGLDAAAGVELSPHLTAVDLLKRKVAVPFDETNPARLRAFEEELRTLLGPDPRLPPLELRVADVASPAEREALGRDPTPADLAAEQAAYASSQRLVRVLGVLVVAIALLVALFVVMAQRWQPR